MKKPTQKEIAELVRQGKWWPFDRVDGKLLERLNRQRHKEQLSQQPKEDALF